MNIKVYGGLLLLLTFSLNAFAAAPPNSGQMLRESEPPPMPVQKQLSPKIDLPQEQQPAIMNGTKVKVSGFNFIGNTVFTEDDLDAMMVNFVDQEMRLAELNWSLKTITQNYRSQGYFLATALIPPQTVKSGEPITVEIIEGIVEKVEVNTQPAETRTPKRLLEGYASRVPVGQPAEEKTLSALAMHTNELPGVEARVVLEPGDERGGTKALLQVTEGKPYSAFIDTDNHGNYSTGYYRFGGGFEFYSPLKLGDLFTFRVQTSDKGDTVNLGAGYSVPVSYYGTRIGFDYQWVSYELGREYESLDAEGEAQNFILSLKQPLVRSRSLILNASLAGEYTLLEDRVNSYQINNERHTSAVHAGLSGVMTDSMFGGGSTSFNAVYTGGDLAFDDKETRFNDQISGGLKTEGRYNKFTLDLYRNQRISDRWSLYLGGHGQLSDKNLDTSEQLYIGGPRAVRAYPIGEASADEGYMVTAELRYLYGAIRPLQGTFQLSAFVDDGRAWIDHDPVRGHDSNRRHLAGAGFGCNWIDYENFSVSTSVAWRTTEKAKSDSKREDSPMVYFQMVKQF